jgi:hypothetical protein
VIFDHFKGLQKAVIEVKRKQIKANISVLPLKNNNYQKMAKAIKTLLESFHMFVGSRDMFLHLRAHNKHVVGGFHMLRLKVSSIYTEQCIYTHSWYIKM